MKANKPTPVEAAKAILAKADKPLKAKELNGLLKKAGIEPLTSTTLTRTFKRVPVKGDSKNKFAYTLKKTIDVPAKPASKKACKAKCAKKAAPKAKKPAPKAKCNKSACTEPCVAKCVIAFDKEYDVRRHNAQTQLRNCLVCKPEAVRNPSAWAFIAGGDDWPEEYEGVRILKDDDSVGVLLVPACRLMTRKVVRAKK